MTVGGLLRYFGDGWQASKVLGGRRYWRIPVMEGEFLVEERFGATEVVLEEHLEGAESAILERLGLEPDPAPADQ